MAVVNNSSNFSIDTLNQYIQKKVLDLAKRQICAYQFANKLDLPQGNGTTYMATRYSRLNLPFAPLQEGGSSVGESMTVTQVQGTVQQWGDLVRTTDVADLTPVHDVFQQAVHLVGIQVAETLERNAYTAGNGLLAGANVNYAGSVASRAALGSTNVLSPHEINRAVGTLNSVGAPKYGEPDKETYEVNPQTTKGVVQPHYVSILHPLVAQDMRENTTISTAWSYSDIRRLYTYEIGEWGGVRFTTSNMVPYWVGVAAISGTAGTAGSLATGTYYIQVTASPALTSMEQKIYQVSAGVAVTGPTGSISVTLPNVPGYVFNVYIGTTTSPVNLGLSTSGPSTGAMAGQATQMAGNQTVVITGTGASQTPPAAPATGITVFPTFVIGKNSYGSVMLDSLKTFYLKDADKSDPQNTTRVVSWKIFYGMIVLNQAFFMRIESASAFSASFDSGPVVGQTF